MWERENIKIYRYTKYTNIPTYSTFTIGGVIYLKTAVLTFR